MCPLTDHAKIPARKIDSSASRQTDSQTLCEAIIALERRGFGGRDRLSCGKSSLSLVITIRQRLIHLLVLKRH